MNKCEICKHENHSDSFLCEECGFDLELTITNNSFGLPEINIL